MDNVTTGYYKPCPINGECNQGKLECSRGYRKYGKLSIEDGECNLVLYLSLEAIKKKHKTRIICLS